MSKYSQVLHYFLLTVTGTLVLTACAFRPSPLTEQELTAKRDAFIADGGYSAARLFEIDTNRERWWRDGKALDISLLAPIGSSSYPLIIYLPGLDEDVESGRLWREHWAKAGYAVLSIQPEALATAFAGLNPARATNMDDAAFFVNGDDKEAPPEQSDEQNAMPDRGKRRSSQAGRNGELRYIGHEFFAAESLRTRVEQVLWTYSQCQQRVKAKQGLFARVDLANVWIIGYDIGAQAAAALIGERTDVVVPKTNDFKPHGAILISPSVDVSPGKLRDRYHLIGLPLLVVSSELDDDPYGITTPQLRRAVWDYAASDEKYLLWLKQANHQLLSGSGWAQSRQSMQNREHDSERPMPELDRFQGDARRNGGPPGGMGRPSHPDGPPAAPIHQQVAVIASVSTAFMDSISKKDNFAALWLRQNAQPWLKSIAKLTGR